MIRVFWFSVKGFNLAMILTEYVGYADPGDHISQMHHAYNITASSKKFTHTRVISKTLKSRAISLIYCCSVCNLHDSHASCPTWDSVFYSQLLWEHLISSKFNENSVGCKVVSAINTQKTEDYGKPPWYIAKLKRSQFKLLVTRTRDRTKYV